MWTTITHENYKNHWDLILKGFAIGSASNLQGFEFCYNEEKAASKFENLKSNFASYYFDQGDNQMGIILRKNLTCGEWHIQQIRAKGDFSVLKPVLLDKLAAIREEVGETIYIDRQKDHDLSFEDYCELPGVIN
jgi:hypothetical protein